MKKPDIKTLAIFLLLAATLVPFSASAVEARKNTGKKWESTPCNVAFYTTYEGTKKNYIQYAMNKWNAVRSPDGDKLVTFSLTTDGGSTNRISYVNGSQLYVAHTYTYPINSPTIESVEIVVNEDYTNSTSPTSSTYDFQTIIQHELGHALGVARCHEAGETSCFSSTCSQNVMNPELAKGEKRRTLQEYDTASYQYIYY